MSIISEYLDLKSDLLFVKDLEIGRVDNDIALESKWQAVAGLSFNGDVNIPY